MSVPEDTPRDPFDVLQRRHAAGLIDASRFEEAKSLLHKSLPVAQRVLGNTHEYTLRIGKGYAKALCLRDCVTLDDLHEAVTTLEGTVRIARRVLGGAHPLTAGIEEDLREARAALDARETPPGSS